MIDNIFDTSILLILTVVVVRAMSADDTPDWYRISLVVIFVVSLIACVISGLMIIWA